MLCSQLQVLLVALSASVFLARVSAAPHRDMLAELLRADTTKGNEDLSRTLLLKMMSDLMSTAVGENELLPDLEEALGVREEVVRQLPLSHRERKAGCRNFFWKTFTSC
ncbi:somatostatin-1 [Oncorhynchus nerka]|uniref:somatostatin-1 n=1 Tax=Oncorhynchus nerka TaxID=8023 RepID=UPI0031B86A23